MTHIFARWSVITWRERIRWIANAVHIIEEFPEKAAPCLSRGKRVMGHEMRAARYVALDTQGKTVVAGTIVGAKYIRFCIPVVAVAVHPRFVRPVGADEPARREFALDSCRRVQRVGCV